MLKLYNILKDSITASIDVDNGLQEALNAATPPNSFLLH